MPSMRLLGLIGAVLVLAAVSFSIGRYPMTPGTALAVLGGQWLPVPKTWGPETEVVVLSIRLPRILAALLVGSALSVSGAAYQGLFRNPMVSPDILGVSAGAALGAALAILFGGAMLQIQVCAFVGGLLAVSASGAIGAALAQRGDPVLVMVLAGIIIGTLFAALVSLVKFVADPNNTLPTITYWLMGGLGAVTLGDLAAVAPAIVVGVAVLTRLGWTLNVMSFGDDEARALGLSTRRLRLVVVVCATLATAAAVSISGLIGLVGLIVPHLGRMLVGPDHRRLLPVAALLGGGYLLAVDDLARSLFAVELPLGIVTSLIGAPFFIYLLARGQRAW